MKLTNVPGQYRSKRKRLKLLERLSVTAPMYFYPSYERLLAQLPLTNNGVANAQAPAAEPGDKQQKEGREESSIPEYTLAPKIPRKKPDGPEVGSEPATDEKAEREKERIERKRFKGGKNITKKARQGDKQAGKAEGNG